MRDGETVVLAGLIQEEDRKNREAVPGIDDIPGIGDLLSNSNTEKITTEVIVVITPRIVRSLTPPQLAKQTLWSGTAKQYNTQPLFSQHEPGNVPYSDISVDEDSSPTNSPLPGSANQSPEPNTEVIPDSLPPEDEANADSSPPEVSRLQMIPAAASMTIGEQISLSLQGQNFSSAEQTSLTLTYDPAILTFKQAIEGPFLTSQQVPPSLTVSALPNAGQLVIQIGQKGNPVQGSGTLATLVFEAIETGTANIHIQNPDRVRS